MKTQVKAVKLSPFEVMVIAYNVLADIFPPTYEAEKSRLLTFKGKSIFKVDGSLMERFKFQGVREVKGKLPDNTNYSGTWHIAARGEKIYFSMKLCVNGGSYDNDTAFCQYVNHAADVCKYKGAVGEPLADDMPARYNKESIYAAVRAVEVAEDAYSKALAQVPYQFRDSLRLKRLTHS